MPRRRRPVWNRLPAGLRAAVECSLGSRVIETEAMAAGWSPGSADRVLLADGRRAFVKAADADVNAVSVALHRREAAVLAALAGTGVAPDPLGTADDGAWFALIVEDLGGRHPDPADAEDTRAVLDAVAALPDPVPAAVPSAGETLQDVLADAAAGWDRLLTDGADTVPGGGAVVRELRARSAGAADLVTGTQLVHGDLRVDNVLVTPGGARLVDWPNALEGRAWFDGLTYLLDALRLAPEVPLPFDHPLFDGVGGDAIDAATAALAGYFMDSARLPPQPGVEAVRAFQREQGLVLIDLLTTQRSPRYWRACGWS